MTYNRLKTLVAYDRVPVRPQYISRSRWSAMIKMVRADLKRGV